MQPTAARRLVATLPPSTYDRLDHLADGPRFAGNRSAAVAWCVDIGTAVLNDPAVADTLFASAADALKVYRKATK